MEVLPPFFQMINNVVERDKFYKSLSFSGTGGASGHDAPMIAYGALLGCKEDCRELCMRSMFHGGDSDSTGIITAAIIRGLEFGDIFKLIVR